MIWSGRFRAGGSAAHAVLLAVLALALYTVPLASYWESYFPYEDDFPLVYYSGHANDPHPAEWLTAGYSRYFDNGSACAQPQWGFARPLVNLTFYLESFLATSESYSAYLLANILAYLVSVLLVYSLALALGMRPRTATVLALVFAVSPCWYRILHHASFRTNGLCTMWTLLGFRLLLAGRELKPVRPLRQMAAGACALLAAASHEQGYFILPAYVALAIAPLLRKPMARAALRGLASAARVLGPCVLYVAAIKFANSSYGHNYAFSGLQHIPWAYLAIGAIGRLTFLFTPVDLHLLAIHDSRWLAAMWLTNVLVYFTLIHFIRRARHENRTVLTMACCYVLCALPVVAYGSPELRFQGTTAAMGILAIAAALACGAGGCRLRGVLAACLGLIAVYGAVCYGQSVLGNRSHYQQRSAADRASYSRLRDALRANPGAGIVLVNDQMGTWGARAMASLAAGRFQPVTVLPTAAHTFLGASFDFAPSNRCPAEAKVLDRDGQLFFQMSNFGRDCELTYYGVSMPCVCREFAKQGLASNCRSAEVPRRMSDRATFAVPRTAGPLVVATWGPREEPAQVAVFPPVAQPPN